MSNVKITELPQLALNQLTDADILPIVNNDTTTTKVTFSTLYTGVSNSILFDTKSQLNSQTTYLSGQVDGKLSLTGGTVTGSTTFNSAVVLNSAPTLTTHATPKSYVDTADRLRAPLSAAQFTGIIQAPSATFVSITSESVDITGRLTSPLIQATTKIVAPNIQAGAGGGSGATIGTTAAHVLFRADTLTIPAAQTWLIVYDLYYIKTTAGTVTFVLSSVGGTFSEAVSIKREQSPAAGIAANGAPTITNNIADINDPYINPNFTVAPTVSLTTGVRHYSRLEFMVVGNATNNTTYVLVASCSAGTAAFDRANYFYYNRITS